MGWGGGRGGDRQPPASSAQFPLPRSHKSAKSRRARRSLPVRVWGRVRQRVRGSLRQLGASADLHGERREPITDGGRRERCRGDRPGGDKLLLGGLYTHPAAPPPPIAAFVPPSLPWQSPIIRQHYTSLLLSIFFLPLLLPPPLPPSWPLLVTGSSHTNDSYADREVIQVIM